MSTVSSMDWRTARILHGSRRATRVVPADAAAAGPPDREPAGRAPGLLASSVAPMRWAGLGLMVAGGLLAAAALYAQAAWALPLLELPWHPRFVPGSLLLAAGTLMTLASTWCGAGTRSRGGAR
jgi:hypothetical protein